MIPILYRYIAMELSVPFSLSLMVLTFILLFTKVLNIAELLFSKGASLGIIWDILVSLTLYLVGFSLPLAFLISILICFGRLSQDSEVIALRASGVSLTRISVPVFIFGFILAFFSFYLHVSILPKANWKSNLAIHKLAQSDPSSLLQEKVWLTGFGRSWVYIHRLYDENKFRQIAIHQPTLTSKLPRVITAKNGHYEFDEVEKEIRFHLVDGKIEEPHAENDSLFDIVNFGEYTVSAPLTKRAFTKPQKKVIHLTRSELDERIENTPASQIDYRSLILEKSTRTCMSFACLVFFLVGFPLSIALKRGDKSANFAVGAILALVWYLLLLMGKAMALTFFTGGVNVTGATIAWVVTLSTWLPNIILGGIGLFLTAKMVGR